jgi:hypothetical protein
MSSSAVTAGGVRGETKWSHEQVNERGQAGQVTSRRRLVFAQNLLQRKLARDLVRSWEHRDV